MKRINRKRFFRLLGSFLLIPAGYFWIDSTRKSINDEEGNILQIQQELNNGIHFTGAAIIIKEPGDKLRVFSSKCTHLGCRIKSSQNNKLVCPCHGSTYNLYGIPLKGPAVKPLRELEYERMQDNTLLIKF